MAMTRRFEQARDGPIALRLGVVNLLDEGYLLRGQTGVGVFANPFGPGRSVFASLAKEFRSLRAIASQVGSKPAI